MSVVNIPNAYAELLVRYEPKVIRDDRAHRRALCKIDELMALTHPSKCQKNILDLLVETVERYEERTLPTPKLSPGELLAHLIEACGRTQAEVARVTSICRSSISDILAGRRQISKVNALKLADYFAVDVSLFIQ